MTCVIGGIIATLLLGWLAVRAQKEARTHAGRRVVEYGRAAKVAGWCFVLLGVCILYAAAHASKEQTATAACVGGGLFAGCMALFAEFNLVRIEFDEDVIHTYSPWRKRRVIVWADVIGYRYSEMNRWHILKTRHSGSVRLSVLLSGLGTFFDEMRRRKLLG